nr:C2 calcium/lipid-binding domain, CaLB [Tanacetum cinerariifolium]
MDDDLFTYKVEITGIGNVPCDLNRDDDSEQQMSQESNNDIEYDPSDVEFTAWLASKNFNYKTIDHYIKRALWIYWLRGDDEVELTDKESSDSDDEGEAGGIFRIKTNVFDFETPLCRTFKEVNYLLQIDLDENFGNTNDDRYEREYENDQDDEERCELFDDATQELLVCTVRRFKMIKYSFGQDKEYVAVKEDEYEDLMSTSKDACRAYQEIFRKMEEG